MAKKKPRLPGPKSPAQQMLIRNLLVPAADVRSFQDHVGVSRVESDQPFDWGQGGRGDTLVCNLYFAGLPPATDGRMELTLPVDRTKYGGHLNIFWNGPHRVFGVDLTGAAHTNDDQERVPTPHWHDLRDDGVLVAHPFWPPCDPAPDLEQAYHWACRRFGISVEPSWQWPELLQGRFAGVRLR